MKVPDYSSHPIKFDLFEYFRGKTTGWGYFENRFQTVKRQFKVDIIGTVETNILTLLEDFFYADGEQSQRIWVIEQTAPGQFTGQSSDVIGKAKGHSSGNTFKWQYQLKLKVGHRFWHLDFNDWMFLQSDDVLLNRAIVTKWGIEIGRVQLFFKKD